MSSTSFVKLMIARDVDITKQHLRKYYHVITRWIKEGTSVIKCIKVYMHK